MIVEHKSRCGGQKTYMVEIACHRLPYCADDLARRIPSESQATFDLLNGVHEDFLCAIAQPHLRRGRHNAQPMDTQDMSETRIERERRFN